jgi:hypothetical protein
MMHHAYILALAAFALTTAAVARPARAQTKGDQSACRAAYEDGQRLRRGKKLLEAREKLLVCARSPCPAVFQPECIKWLEEIEAEIPTVVVSVEGAKEGVPVRVLVDGETFAERADGVARPLDPGEHELVAVSEDQRVSRRVMIVEGGKAQRFDLAFPERAEPPAASRVETPGEPAREPGRPVPALTWVLAGVGVVAGGASGFFAYRGLSQRDDIQGCSPNCLQSDVDEARRSLLVADVALGVSIVALGAALVLYLSRPYEEPPATTTAMGRF